FQRLQLARMQSESSAAEADLRDDEEEDEDDEGDFDDVQRPVLGFGDGPEVDVSALEYLRSVQAEARRCPKVVVAKQPVPLAPGRPSGPQQSRGGGRQPVWPDAKCRGMQVSALLASSSAVTSPDRGIAATPDWAPGTDWQAEQVAAFAELRDRLAESLRLASSRSAAAEAPRLPKASDGRAWRAFCYGTGGTAAGDWRGDDEDGSSGEDEDSGDDDGEELESGRKEAADGEDEESGGAEAQSEEGHPPLISLVCRLPRASLLALLGHHADWLTGPEPLPFTDRLGQWLFALLAALRCPLTSEEADRLRRLARACRRERLRLPGGLRHPAAVPLSLIICLVARHFGQADLADD
uniref:Gem-associated protein 2 n=2 Tax=Macrostomum lignano TaxID=282301 RepID=A0A1I8HX65_9PLAT